MFPSSQSPKFFHSRRHFTCLMWDALFSGFFPFSSLTSNTYGGKNPHDLISPQVVTPEPFGDRRGEKAAFMIEPREGGIERGKDSWNLQHNVKSTFSTVYCFQYISIVFQCKNLFPFSSKGKVHNFVKICGRSKTTICTIHDRFMKPRPGRCGKGG